MKLNPYRNAYEQATLEVNEILAKFDQLCQRKDKLEALIAAFRPLLEQNGQAPAEDQRLTEQATHSPAPGSEWQRDPSQEPQPEMAYSHAAVPSSLPSLDETGGDPFQSRAKSGYRFRGIGQEHRVIQRGA
jgi:hypothetical protein